MAAIGLTKVSNEPLVDYLAKNSMIWTVTMHNGRKLKKYPEVQSHRFRGIQNLENRIPTTIKNAT